MNVRVDCIIIIIIISCTIGKTFPVREIVNKEKKKKKMKNQVEADMTVICDSYLRSTILIYKYYKVLVVQPTIHYCPLPVS